MPPGEARGHIARDQHGVQKQEIGVRSYRFGELTSPEIGAAAQEDSLLLLPIGTTEEHGPHLPVDTDARIAEAYGTRLTAALAREMPVLLMDTIRYGYSMKIMRQWPGTIIVRSRVFMDMVFDIC